MSGGERLSRISIVLDHPKDVVNIGGMMRVMNNFGLTDLRLVNPDVFDAYRLEGIAHRSRELIAACTIHETLADALADRTFIVGTTARPRSAGRRYVRPREAATTLSARAADGPCAVLFGREDRGLTNDGLDLCDAVAIIPTDADFSSLNLAQAGLVMAYELFLAVERGEDELPKGRRSTRPPTRDELEETFAAIETGLGRIEFYKARKPEAVMRTIRTIVARADPDLREVRLLGAVGYEIANYLDRIDQP